MITARVKSAFFDRAAVQAAMDVATLKTLSRFGAFVRRRAQTSMRRTGAVSQPGSPPSSHAGQLRDLLYFAWDGSSRSVVIGPTPFKDVVAPKLLEEGGTIIDRLRGRSVRKVYRTRPFMKPAFDAELAKMPQGFKDSARA